MFLAQTKSNDDFTVAGIRLNNQPNPSTPSTRHRPRPRPRPNACAPTQRCLPRGAVVVVVVGVVGVVLVQVLVVVDFGC